MMTFAQNYAFSAIVTSVTAFVLMLLVFLRASNRKLVTFFCWYLLTIAHWSAFVFACTSVDNYQTAFILCQVCHSLGVFIPVAFLHFVQVYTNSQDAYLKTTIRGGYFFTSLISLSIIFAPHLFIRDMSRKLTFNYFPDPGVLFFVWNFLFVVFVSVAFFTLARAAYDRKGQQRKALVYFLAANVLGYLGGIGCFLPVYNLNFFPFPYGLWGVFFFSCVTAYAVLRHRFIDVESLIRKTIVFAGLFGIIIAIVGVITSLVQNYLGQLIGMGQTAQQILSILIVIFLFDPTRKILTNLTDRFLFQKKYDYHKLLKDASRGMSNIESLEHLSGLVVHFITMKMRVRNAAVLMREGTSDQYHLIYQRGFDKKFLTLTLYQNDPLIHYLENHKEAVDIERIQEQVEASSYERDQSEKAYDYEAIRERMSQLQATCCVPSFLGRELRNVLLLGEKKSGDYYSNEDLNLLYTLAQESSIAIENARLYDEALRKSHELQHINEQLEHSKTLLTKALQEAEGANKQLQDTQAQLIHEQKMATLGRLAASVGHEVNNPLTILSMNVSRVILKYRKNQDMKVTEILEVFDKMEKNIERIKAVVNTLTGLLKKSEKGKFEPLSLKLILEETLPLVQFQTYLDNLSGTEVDFNVPGNVPLIRGDLERLQEVFLNLFINAYHAMAGKRHRKIGVLAEIDPQDPKRVAIHFRDNGSGMTEEVMKKIFNYGYTTKAPGKGSGLGLYMCKYIIELHGGTITAASKIGEGTTFTLTLPIYSEAPALKSILRKGLTG